MYWIGKTVSTTARRLPVGVPSTMVNSCTIEWGLSTHRRALSHHLKHSEKSRSLKATVATLVMLSTFTLLAADICAGDATSIRQALVIAEASSHRGSAAAQTLSRHGKEAYDDPWRLVHTTFCPMHIGHRCNVGHAVHLHHAGRNRLHRDTGFRRRDLKDSYGLCPFIRTGYTISGKAVTVRLNIHAADLRQASTVT